MRGKDASECGDVIVEFIDFEIDWYFDRDPFTVANNEFTVNTSDFIFLGEYNIGVWAYFVNFSSGTYASSDTSFKLIITNLNCDVAVITSPGLEF